jgi:L-alanine-DL-glutamate epimerase-like enolase superfamily enzyme
VELSARIVSLELAETFTIARGSQDVADVVEIEIKHEGVSGFGEATPQEVYDESIESAKAYAEAVAPDLGDDPFALEAIMERLPPTQYAARAAIDAALHDLCGKLLGEPVWRLLGLERGGPPTAWTIGLADPDTMAQKAEKADASGRFKRMKLKLGGRDGLDVERVRAVRGVTEIPLQVDVNEYWTFDEAVDALPHLEELGVEYCEQPLRHGDDDGTKLKAASPIPIFVDEDCHTLKDVAECAGIAHGINIKLAKSGGIREAVRMAHTARALGLGVMLGCMIESGLGIAPGAAIASLCDYIDLDGNLLIAHDPWPGVELVDGVQTPSEEPGLGVRQAVPSPR